MDGVGVGGPARRGSARRGVAPGRGRGWGRAVSVSIDWIGLDLEGDGDVGSAAGGVVEDFEIFSDGLGDSEFEGLGDEGVADGDLEEDGDGAEEVGEVFEGEVVAGVEAESGGLCGPRGEDVEFEDAREGVGAGGAGLGVGGGVEFDAVGAEFGGGGDVGRAGVHEEGDAAAEVLEAADDGAEGGSVGAKVPAVVGGEGVDVVGDQGALGG